MITCLCGSFNERLDLQTVYVKTSIHGCVPMHYVLSDGFDDIKTFKAQYLNAVYNNIQYNTIQYNTIQYNTIQ